jgi:hypothetical protein
MGEQARFTKGPWAADNVQTSCDEFRYDSFAVYDEQGRVIVDAMNSDIQDIETEGPDEDGHVDRWDERARLNCQAIAALPDLYEAAGLALDLLERVGDSRKDAPVIDALRAALAKAEGRS